jgi:hypothetical protein
MPRKIYYKASSIEDQSLVVGNHGHTQIMVAGEFLINGLVYCPKYRLELAVKGKGTISLHGICKSLVIHRVLVGTCILDVSDLVIGELLVHNVSGKLKLLVGRNKNVIVPHENVEIIRVEIPRLEKKQTVVLSKDFSFC